MFHDTMIYLPYNSRLKANVFGKFDNILELCEMDFLLFNFKLKLNIHNLKTKF